MEQNQIIIYQAEDGTTAVDVKLENETVWLTQAQIQQLFNQTKQNISLHIKNIFNEEELPADAVVKESLTTANDPVQKTVLIDAPAPAVWATLTISRLVQQWTYDTPIQIQTDWKVGSAIVTSGDLHRIPFSNSGTIIAFEPNVKLSYTFLSSLSNLPDTDENHCVLEFDLVYENKQTKLDLSISNFPDDVIRKHLELYWGPTLELIKQQTESRYILFNPL